MNPLIIINMMFTNEYDRLLYSEVERYRLNSLIDLRSVRVLVEVYSNANCY